MFVGITNTPRDYAWGSDGQISELLGTAPSGRPEAELWLGTHPGSPARVVDTVRAGVDSARLGADSEQVGVDAAHATLAEWIDGAGQPRLPFLLKVLAASAPLSLQAHPTTEQARDGFARENALGIPVDAPNRNYRDPHAKPEIILAVSDRFEALCGFRPVADTVALVRALGLDDLAERLEAQPLASVFEWLITRGPGVDSLTARVAALAAAPPPPAVLKTKEIGGESGTTGAETTDIGRSSFVLSDATDAALDTVRRLAAAYPGDPGIAISLLINRVTLRQGEALYLPAGNIHAYLEGVGIELMTASDNVLRGGLTTKHVDVDELLSVLDFGTNEIPYLRAVHDGGAHAYQPDGPGFALHHIDGPASRALTGPAIALCTAGGLTMAGASSTMQLARGDAIYITPDEAELAFAGQGELYLATTA